MPAYISRLLTVMAYYILKKRRFSTIPHASAISLIIFTISYEIHYAQNRIHLTLIKHFGYYFIYSTHFAAHVLHLLYMMKATCFRAFTREQRAATKVPSTIALHDHAYETLESRPKI